MNVRSFLIKRFFISKQERTPIISMFGILGVLLGVLAVIVVISVMSGFEKDLIGRLIGTQPHIYITGTESGGVLKNWQSMIDQISNDKKLLSEIEAYSPFVESETIMYFDNVTMGGVLFSVSNDFFNKLSELKLGKREIILGQQFGVTNRIYEGDEVEILSAWDFATSTTSIPKLRRFKVKNYVRTGTYSRDLKYFYANLEDSIKYFTSSKGVPNGIAILAKQPYKLDGIIKRINELFKDQTLFKIETWQDRNSRVFYSLKLERLAMMFTLFFIIIIASFSIVISLVLMVEAKKKDFTILLSMGMEKKELRNILLIIGFLKGTLGAILGGILGTFFCYLLEKYQFISLPSIYYDTHLPVSYDIKFNIIVVLSAIVICLIGVLYPMAVVSRLSVSSQLRKL